MSYRRLTPEEIEQLRAEMRAAGQWMKTEMARRRRERGEAIEAETSASPITNGETPGSASGDEQVRDRSVRITNGDAFSLVSET